MMTLEQASPWVSTSFSRACAPLRHFSLKCNIVFTYSIMFISITEKSLLQTLGTLYFILVLVSYPLFIFELLFMWFFFFQWFHCFHFLAETSYSSHFLLFRTIIWITEYYNQRGGKPLCMYIVVYSLSHDQLFCNPMDCSPPDFSVHGISQARILEWVVTSFSRDLPDPGTEPVFLHWQVDSFTTELPGKPLLYMHLYLYMACTSIAVSANGYLYIYLYMRSLYIYIAIHTHLHKLFYIHHWQRNCYFYSIQITLEHFLKNHLLTERFK